MSLTPNVSDLTGLYNCG